MTTFLQLFFTWSFIYLFFLWKLKKLEQAIEDCTKAIKLDETYIKAYLRRAQWYVWFSHLWDRFVMILYFIGETEYGYKNRHPLLQLHGHRAV